MASKSTEDSGDATTEGRWLASCAVLLIGVATGDFAEANDFDRVFDSATDAGYLISPILAEANLRVSERIEEGSVLRVPRDSLGTLFTGESRERNPAFEWRFALNSQTRGRQRRNFCLPCHTVTRFGLGFGHVNRGPFRLSDGRSRRFTFCVDREKVSVKCWQ